MQQQILTDLNHAGLLPEGAGIAAAGNTLSQVSALAGAYASQSAHFGGMASVVPPAARLDHEAYPMSDSALAMHAATAASRHHHMGSHHPALPQYAAKPQPQHHEMADWARSSAHGGGYSSISA
jgi:hypothetical protein